MGLSNLVGQFGNVIKEALQISSGPTVPQHADIDAPITLHHDPFQAYPIMPFIRSFTSIGNGAQVLSSSLTQGRQLRFFEGMITHTGDTVGTYPMNYNFYLVKPGMDSNSYLNGAIHIAAYTQQLSGDRIVSRYTNNPLYVFNIYNRFVDTLEPFRDMIIPPGYSIWADFWDGSATSRVDISWLFWVMPQGMRLPT